MEQRMETLVVWRKWLLDLRKLEFPFCQACVV